MELCVFDEQGNEQRFDLPARAAATSGTAGWPPPGRACATAIGYMVPDPAQGHRFNPAKLLIDPGSAHRVEGDLA
ncbi:hypothetical protein LNP74_10570 [Klebsiella pneumoniae subsp. pneumoniae]|nr:hypothetical protein [Klebsiella pneumoniae subsp. pneumoniae]